MISSNSKQIFQLSREQNFKMFVIDNLFSMFIFEAVLAVYLLSNYNNVKYDTEDNIYRQWCNRGEKPRDYSFVKSVWKRYMYPKGTGWIKTDEFTEFVKDSQVFINTFWLFLALSLFLYFLCCIFIKTLSKAYITKNSHLLKPGQFNSSVNTRDWLANFDSYLDEDGIVEKEEKCRALFSRLNSTEKTLVLNTDRHAKKDYKILKDVLIKLYGGKKKPTTVYAKEFLELNQDGINLYQYYAKLMTLANKAYPIVDSKTKTNLVDEKFIDGLSSSALRAAVLVKIREPLNNHFGLYRKHKTILEHAVELNDIYDRENVRINAVQESHTTSDIICYGCGSKGHIKRDCTNPSTSKYYTYTNNNSNNINRTNKNTNKLTAQPLNLPQANIYNIELKKIQQCSHITGWCDIDGNNVSFMADTGAMKTIIDVSILRPEQRESIKPTPYHVVMADGTKAHILGQKLCQITLGNHVVMLDVLVTERLNEQCLLGIDFLGRCPSTTSVIEELRQVMTNGSNDVVRTEHKDGITVMSSMTSFGSNSE